MGILDQRHVEASRGQEQACQVMIVDLWSGLVTRFIPRYGNQV